MLKHMARRTKVLLGVVVGVPMVIAALGLAYLFFSDLEALRPTFTRYLSNEIGREFLIAGDFAADFGRVTRIEATDVSLANPGWSGEPYMVHVDHLVAELDLLAALSGPLIFDDAEIRGAKVLFETDEEGRFNWVFSSDRPPSTQPPKPFQLLIRHAVLHDVSVAYQRATTTEDVALEIDRLEITADEREILDMSLSGVFEGEPAQLTGTFGTLTGLVNADAVEHDLEFRLADATISTAGSIARVGSLSGIDATVTAEGPALERITAILGVTDGVPGPFSSTAELTANAAGEHVDLTARLGELEVRVQGELDSFVKTERMDLQMSAAGPDAAGAAALFGLPTISRDEFEVSGRLQWGGFPAALEEVQVRLGANTLSANGTVGRPPHFDGTNFEFEGQGPDITAIAALARVELPADSYQMSGRLVREDDRIRFDALDARIEHD